MTLSQSIKNLHIPLSNQWLPRIETFQAHSHARIRPVVLFKLIHVLGGPSLCTFPCVFLDLRGTWAADLVEVQQGLLDVVGGDVAAQEEPESFRVFNGLRTALSLVGCHSMRCIADEYGAATDVGRKRVLVAQLPQLEAISSPCKR